MRYSSDLCICCLVNDWYSLAMLNCGLLGFTDSGTQWPGISMHIPYPLKIQIDVQIQSGLWFAYKSRLRISSLWIKHKVKDTGQKGIPLQEIQNFYHIPVRTLDKMKTPENSSMEMFSTLFLPIRPWWLDRNSASLFLFCSKVGASMCGNLKGLLLKRQI